MGFNGVSVSQSNGGLNRQEVNNDGTVILIVGNAPATGSLALDVVTKLVGVESAEALDITSSYDDANDVLVHYHIDEFFRLSPNATLFLVLASTITEASVEAIIREVPDARFSGYVRNATGTLATEIPIFQNVVNTLRDESFYFDGFILEGDIITEATQVEAFPNLRELDAPNVSVVIGQDPTIADLKPEYENHAGIGSALGMLSVRRVNENIGSVAIEVYPFSKRGATDYSLTDSNRLRWLNARLQNGIIVDTLTRAQKNLLTTNGYIFAGSYQGYAGFFFNNSPTCVSKTSDFAYIENNRIWGKAARLLTTALMPRIKSNLLRDPNTGFIREIEAKELEAIAQKALNSMVTSGEVSGAEVYINAAQTLSESSPLVIKVSLVINGIIYEMLIDLGQTNNI